MAIKRLRSTVPSHVVDNSITFSVGDNKMKLSIGDARGIHGRNGR